MVAGWLATGCADDAPTPDGKPPSESITDAVAVPPEDLAAQFGDAVWQVETDGCDWHGFGSATAVDERHLVTNRHVIANDTSPLVRSRNGDVLNGRVIGASEEPDIAVIEVDTDLSRSLLWAPTNELQPAEALVVIGYPLPDYRFTVTSGSVVSFVGDVDHREAVLSDAVIDRGNSGGPALRSDGTVAGVVTQMSLDDPAERVAIIFTADTLLPVIDDAIANPIEVVSDCGLGPDYVPPAPTRFEIDEPPPPPTSTTTTRATTPPTTTSPKPTTSSSTTFQCPGSGVETTYEPVTVREDEEQPGTWLIQVAGTATNQSSAAIDFVGIVVEFAGETAQGIVIPISDMALAPGQTRSIDGSAAVESPSGEPSVTGISAELRWRYTEFVDCPPPLDLSADG